MQCSFCSRTDKNSDYILEGPRDGIAICNFCIEEGHQIVDKNRKDVKNKVEEDTEFSPQFIYDQLEEHVIGQEDAKRALAIASYDHYQRIKYPIHGDVEIEKSNVVMFGPTGVGKTLLVKNLAKILDVPLTIGDATTITAAGYVGEDVENMLARLVRNANGDYESAEQGIVYIDEFDKLARKSGENTSISRDVSGEGVQNALLKILEGTLVNLPVEQIGRRHPMAPTVVFDTSRVLFIVGGAFVGLDKIVEKRKNEGTTMGFGTADKTNKVKYENVGEALKYAAQKDLEKFGIIPELVGRLPVMVSLKNLDREKMIRILTEPKNALTKQFQALFSLDGVEITFEKEFLEHVADKAIESGTGARALRGIIEKIIEPLSFERKKFKGRKIEIKLSTLDENVVNLDKLVA